MIGPGDVYFISPSSDLNGRRFASGDIVAPPPADQETDERIQSFADDYLGGRVVASIDANVYEDGKLVGDDKSKLMQRTNARILAEKDLLDMLVPLSGVSFRAALTGKPLDNPQLEKHQELRQAAIDNPDYYDRHMNFRREELTEFLNKSGEDSVRQALKVRRYGKWFKGSDVISRRDTK